MSDTISYARVKSDLASAHTYNQRRQSKHAAEMAMIDEAMCHVHGVATLLDAPCGVGRASIALAHRGLQVTGVDLGEAALQLAEVLAAEAKASVRFERHDLFALPHADRAFDAALCFRLLHHFESPAVRRRLLDELCRVSARYVLVSRLSPLSVTSLRRRLRQLLTGKAIKQHSVSARELHAEMARNGFEPVAKSGRFALFHSLQLQVYSRK